MNVTLQAIDKTKDVMLTVIDKIIYNFDALSKALGNVYGKTETYTQQEVRDLIAQAKNELINGAGPAFDTLKEIADALGDDQNAYNTLLTMINGKATKPLIGKSNFASMSGVTIPHSKGDTNYHVNVTPLGNPDGIQDVGEIYVDYNNNNFVVRNSGASTEPFSYEMIF